MGQTDRQTDSSVAHCRRPSVVGDVHTGHSEVVGVSEVLLDKATWDRQTDRQTDRRIAALLNAAAQCGG